MADANQPEYPKWVQRAPDIGPVLVADKEAEDELRADWKAERAEHKANTERKTADEREAANQELLNKADAIRKDQDLALAREQAEKQLREAENAGKNKGNIPMPAAPNKPVHK